MSILFSLLGGGDWVGARVIRVGTILVTTIAGFARSSGQSVMSSSNSQ